MKKMIALLALFLTGLGLSAAEYGRTVREKCEFRYVVAVGNPEIKLEPSDRSKTIEKTSPGDIIYVSNKELTYVGGVNWVEIPGSRGFIKEDNLRREMNPYYVTDAPKPYNPLAGMKISTVPKWIIITVIVLTVLLSLVALVLLLGDPFEFDNLTIFGNLRHPNLHKYESAGAEKIYGEGMRKNMFLCPETYWTFLVAAGVFVLAFVASILIFIIIGSLVWLLSWIGCITLYILYWVIGIGGILAALGFGFYLFSEKDGCLGLIVGGALLGVAIFISVMIFSNLDELYYFADDVASFGQSVFSTFNIFSAALELVMNYGIAVLIVAFAPLCVYLVCAVLYLLFAGSLILYEHIVMKRYNVQHPCPTCGRPSEPAEYYSHGIPLPVNLKPGPWGLFHITHPATSEKMPTLFLNGKDNYARKCPHCNSFVRANVGIEKHIAVAGVHNSGKTTLLYRLISEMLHKKIGKESVCAFTDKAGSDEAALQSFLDTIKNGEAMTSDVDQTMRGRHKAIQLLVNNPKNLLPYRLYLNDVAGEMFSENGDSGSADTDSVSYLKNTNLVLFVVNPYTMNRMPEFSDKMNRWYDANVSGIVPEEDRFDMKSSVDALKNHVDKFRSGKEASDISIMIVFTRIDSGYLKGYETSDSAALEQFAIKEMGMEGIINSLHTSFKNISFHAVQSVKAASVSGVPELLDSIFDKLDISFKNVSEEALAANRHKAEERMKDIALNSTAKAVPVKHWTKEEDEYMYGIVSTLAILLVWAALVSSALIFHSISSKKNYYRVSQAVEVLFKENKRNYAAVISVIDESLENDILTKRHRTQLETARSECNKRYSAYVYELLGKVKVNFVAGDKGRACAAEISARYHVMDTLKKIRESLDEIKELAPDNAEYQQYEKQFQDILDKYKIAL